MRKLILALLLTAFAAVAADVSGTWQFNVETNQGSGRPTVVLRQDGEKLAGTFTSRIFGEVAITGSVKGNVFEFGFVGEAGGQKVKVSYHGTVESATTMKGTAVYTGFDDKVTWTATKK